MSNGLTLATARDRRRLDLVVLRRWREQARPIDIWELQRAMEDVSANANLDRQEEA